MSGQCEPERPAPSFAGALAVSPAQTKIEMEIVVCIEQVCAMNIKRTMCFIIEPVIQLINSDVKQCEVEKHHEHVKVDDPPPDRKKDLGLRSETTYVISDDNLKDACVIV